MAKVVLDTRSTEHNAVEMLVSGASEIGSIVLGALLEKFSVMVISSSPLSYPIALKAFKQIQKPPFLYAFRSCFLFYAYR